MLSGFVCTYVWEGVGLLRDTGARALAATCHWHVLGGILQQTSKEEAWILEHAPSPPPAKAGQCPFGHSQPLGTAGDSLWPCPSDSVALRVPSARTLRFEGAAT